MDRARDLPFLCSRRFLFRSRDLLPAPVLADALIAQGAVAREVIACLLLAAPVSPRRIALARRRYRHLRGRWLEPLIRAFPAGPLASLRLRSVNLACGAALRVATHPDSRAAVVGATDAARWVLGLAETAGPEADGARGEELRTASVRVEMAVLTALARAGGMGGPERCPHLEEELQEAARDLYRAGLDVLGPPVPQRVLT